MPIQVVGCTEISFSNHHCIISHFARASGKHFARLKQFFEFCAPGCAVRKILRGRDPGRARQTFQSVQTGRGHLEPQQQGKRRGRAKRNSYTLDSKTLNHLDQIKTNSKVGKFLAVANSGGSSVSQNKLPQLILGYIYILKYLQSNFIG